MDLKKSRWRTLNVWDAGWMSYVCLYHASSTQLRKPWVRLPIRPFSKILFPLPYYVGKCPIRKTDLANWVGTHMTQTLWNFGCIFNHHFTQLPDETNHFPLLLPYTETESEAPQEISPRSVSTTNQIIGNLARIRNKPPALNTCNHEMKVDRLSDIHNEWSLPNGINSG